MWTRRAGLAAASGANFPEPDFGPGLLVGRGFRDRYVITASVPLRKAGSSMSMPNDRVDRRAILKETVRDSLGGSGRTTLLGQHPIAPARGLRLCESDF